jgi:triosephosphate isomerase (TIM)
VPDRRPYIAANWKMHKTATEARDLIARVAGDVAADGPEVIVCPPTTALAAAVEAADGTPVRIGAQNMHSEPHGAFTGEVSAGMLLDLGVEVVILGHSERRALFGETDEALERKVPAALNTGLEPILCVGETEEERNSDATERVLTTQVEADLSDVPDSELAKVVIAYEPVWAIGTGNTATSEQAQEACALIRGLIAKRDQDAAAAVRILYGGSVKPGNAEELLSQPDIDGALVGGASLDPGDFAAIVRAA